MICRKSAEPRSVSYNNKGDAKTAMCQKKQQKKQDAMREKKNAGSEKCLLAEPALRLLRSQIAHAKDRTLPPLAKVTAAAAAAFRRV